jgi:hypothetical protein
MSSTQTKIIAYLLLLAMAASPVCNGYQLGPACITVTAVALASAALITAVSRLMNGLPLIPIEALKHPAVLATIAYFTVGVSTYFIASDKLSYYKEIVQRTTLIWLPLFSCSMGLRKLEHARNMLLSLIPTVGILCLISASAAVSSKFEQPAYVMGLHKNMTASLCATMAIICVAHLLTSKRPKIKLWNFSLNNRLAFGGALALALLGIVAAQGRAGIVEVVAATYIMLICIRAKPMTLVKVSVVLAVGLAVAYFVLPEKAIEHVVSTERHSANQIRIYLWTEMGNNIMKNPFLACGWGNPYVDSTGYVYYDLANVLLFDWMQMGFMGALTLLIMMGTSVWMGMSAARQVTVNSMEGFISLAAVGIVTGKFVHGMLDTFWIARGANLHTWMAVGTCLFMWMWVQQNKIYAPAKTPKRALVAAGQR